MPRAKLTQEDIKRLGASLRDAVHARKKGEVERIIGDAGDEAQSIILDKSAYGMTSLDVSLGSMRASGQLEIFEVLLNALPNAEAKKQAVSALKIIHMAKVDVLRFLFNHPDFDDNWIKANAVTKLSESDPYTVVQYNLYNGTTDNLELFVERFGREWVAEQVAQNDGGSINKILFTYCYSKIETIDFLVEICGQEKVREHALQVTEDGSNIMHLVNELTSVEKVVAIVGPVEAAGMANTLNTAGQTPKMIAVSQKKTTLFHYLNALTEGAAQTETAELKKQVVQQQQQILQQQQQILQLQQQMNPSSPFQQPASSSSPSPGTNWSTTFAANSSSSSAAPVISDEQQQEGSSGTPGFSNTNDGGSGSGG